MRFPIILAIVLGTPLAVAEELPPNMRISVRWITTSTAHASTILGLPKTAGHQYDAASKLIARKEAELLHTAMLTTDGVERASLDSVMEHFHPVEDYMTGTPVPLVGPIKRPTFHNPMERAFLPVSMECTNTGLSIEMDDLRRDGAGTFTGRVSSDWTTLGKPKNITECMDEWGDGSIRVPVFHKTVSGNSISQEAGRFVLVSVLTLLPEPPPPAVPRKVMVFVRVDTVHE